jgi:FG-GAP-like repeat
MRWLAKFPTSAMLLLSLATLLSATGAQAETVADFDGDGQTDVSIWYPHEGHYLIRQSSTGTIMRQKLWPSTCVGDTVGVPGDYDGDGTTDIAVYHPVDGTWYIMDSSTNVGRIVNLGDGEPVRADYDGDGKTDVAIWNGHWRILQSSTNTIIVRHWGIGGDIPVPADYDGDGMADVAVFRPQEGNWYIIKSGSGGVILNWGGSEDFPVPADYDGDGMTDIAIWRQTDDNWYINFSGGGTLVKNWGGHVTRDVGGVTEVWLDTLVPGDYDGDGRTDLAVYRVFEGNWYIIRSSDNTVKLDYLMGDVPLPWTYLPGYKVTDIICPEPPVSGR